MKSDLTSFRVNVPRVLRIRGSLFDLETALIGRVTAEFLKHLIGDSDSAAGLEDDAALCFNEHNLVIDESQDRIGLTLFGNGLLFDQGIQFEELVLQAHETRGYDRARNRIDGLVVRIFSAERLGANADDLGKEMLSRMDHRATSIAARRQWLETAIEQLSELISAIQTETDANDQRRLVLERDLLNCRRARHSQAIPPSTSRIAGMAHNVRNLLKRGDTQQTVSQSSDSIQRQIEQELLHAILRATVLQAEGSFFNSISTILRDEQLRTDEAKTALTDEICDRLRKGETAEASRGWNVAAGELTLNDSTLTEATIDYLWEGRTALWQSISSAFAEMKGQNIFVMTEGVFRQTDFEDIEKVIARHVAEAINDWTVVDIIAARYRAKDDLTGTIMEAFRQVASREFLTLGYDQFNVHRTYASVAYAESAHPSANLVLDSLLQEVLRIVDAEIEIQSDLLDNEVLTFYVEDQSVPITAMEVFVKSMLEYDADRIGNNPLYTPHPDIYRSSVRMGDGVFARADLAPLNDGSGEFAPVVGHISGSGVKERVRGLRRNLRQARRKNLLLS